MDLEKIKFLIYQKYPLIDVATFLQVHVSTVRRRIDLLNNPESPYYNREEYEKLNAQIKENSEHFRDNYINNQSFYKENAMILEAIKLEKMTVEQTQRALKRNMNAVLDIVKSEHFKNPNQVLKNILIKYNYFSLEEKKKLINQSTGIQKEIIFVILKFCLTKENIALVFKTDSKDVLEFYSLFPEYHDSLKAINEQNMNFEEQKQNIFRTKKYYLRRNELITFLNKAQKNEEIEKIEGYQEKLNILQRDKYEILLQHRNDLNEEEQQIRTILLKIRTFIFEGVLKKDISENLSISNEKMDKILFLIKSMNSKFYDEKEYEIIKNQINKNKKEFLEHKMDKTKANYEIHTIPFYIRGISQGKITLSEGMHTLKMGFYTLLRFIKEYNEKEKIENLQKILDDYAFAFQYESKNYALLSWEKRREIVHVALTYRLSIKSLCDLYKTSGDDIENVFQNVNEFYDALKYLLYETENEKEDISLESFRKGKYFLSRKKLIFRNLKMAKEKNEYEKVEAYQEKWLALQKEILDDRDVEYLKTQGILSYDDKLKIVQYRLKYGLTKIKCATIFGISTDTLIAFEEDLMKDSFYYDEKISSLNAFNDEKHSSYKK